ncbi:MAG: histidine kinase [Acidobacteriaceae bacterium]|nr:histidine kinase [Acidobacteriaceae bacterium]
MSFFSIPVSRLSVRQKRLFIVGLSVVFTTALIVWLAVVQRQAQSADDATEHSRQVLSTARALLWELVNTETGMRGYIISGNPVFLEPYNDAVKTIPQTQRRLEELCAQNPKMLLMARLIAPLAQDLLDYHNRKRTLMEAGKFEPVRDAERQGEGKRRMDRLRVDIQAIIDEQEQLDQVANNQYLRTRSRMSWLLRGGLLFAVLLAIFIHGMLVDITERVERLARNNRLAADGKPVGDAVGGRDEIAELDAQFRKLWQDKDLETRRALEIYALELERSNKDLQDFASVASHDLQEPLRKISAFGSRLESHLGDSLDDKGRDYLGRIQNAAQRMSSLNESLLELSRVRSRARTPEQVALHSVVAGVLSDLEERITASAARVEVGTLPVIWADPNQMRQLFQNLIGNALKFMKKDQLPAVSITSRSLRNGNWEIVVQDNGLGFEQRFAEQIFRPFQRLHGRSEFEGNGIGLTIVEKIVARHAGTITVQSEPGVGSKFVITLPEGSKESGEQNDKDKASVNAALAS